MYCDSQLLMATTGTENVPASLRQKLPILWSDCLWAINVSPRVGKNDCHAGSKDFVIGPMSGLVAISP